ncbi:MAG: dual specificity protein phosphatase family protein [Deltaproteobacteria bacterium]|nr:dual specificity protein phosphatase family protein [Deltaproteobacteria bacterium]
MPPTHVRTSKTHPLKVDWLDLPGTERVGLTFAPGKKIGSARGAPWDRDLDLDLDALVALEVGALVCLLEDHELAAFGLRELVPRAVARSIEVLRFPIPDGGVPHDLEAVEQLLAAIEERLIAGRRVVIHCMGGLGRTGTIAGCHLVRRGVAPDEALAALRRVRDPDCPENQRQRDFIARFAGRGVLPWLANAKAARAADRREVRALVERVEAAVRAAPERCFQIDESGAARLVAADRTYAAGRFEVPTLRELRARVAARSKGGRVELTVLTGEHPMTDIGTLQATAPHGTVFQVASQFNCLEAPSARVVRVADYLDDPTQGPRAAISAFPGALLRHYFAPAAPARGGRFVQSDARCLNLLEDVFDPSIAEVKSGYLQPHFIRDPEALARALVERFDDVRVGVHDGVEVVFGHDWGGAVPEGRRIAQVLTSTIALGGYGRDGGSLGGARRQLLRAAYLGTLLAAIDLGREDVVLTKIGGGVFGNPEGEIWDAIDWALGEVGPLVSGTLRVVVNSRSRVDETARARVRARGGVIVER